MRGDYPDAMDDELKSELERDEFVYGSSFAEKTDDGWKRIDPVDVFKETHI